MSADNHNEAVDEDDDEDKKKFVAIKCGFKTIARPEYANILTEILFQRSLQMTKVASLSSLLILFKINEALDNQDYQFFLQDRAYKIIVACFNAILARNINNVNSQYPIPPEFRTMVETFSEEDHFEWPSGEGLGNGLNYFYRDHTRNIKTNLSYHCEDRLESFFRMRCWYLNINNNGSRFDGIDIRNAKQFAYRFINLTNGDEDRVNKMNILMTKLVEIGWCGTENMRYFVKSRWFESLWLFGQIQRQINDFHSVADQWNNIHALFGMNPTNNRAPTIKNFALVPICRYQLKNVRLDIRDLYSLVSNLGAVEKFRNPITNRLNKRSEKSYRERPEDLWNLLFNVDKIKQLGKQKQFHGQILTNSVSVSILYVKPNETCEQNVNSLPTDLEGTKYVIGIDPNEKTWMAVTRRNVKKTVDELAVEVRCL